MPKKKERDLAERKAAADAMGIDVEDVQIVDRKPEYRPKRREPKRLNDSVKQNEKKLDGWDGG